MQGSRRREGEKGRMMQRQRQRRRRRGGKGKAASAWQPARVTQQRLSVSVMNHPHESVSRRELTDTVCAREEEEKKKSEEEKKKKSGGRRTRLACTLSSWGDDDRLSLSLSHTPHA